MSEAERIKELHVRASERTSVLTADPEQMAGQFAVCWPHLMQTPLLGG